MNSGDLFYVKVPVHMRDNNLRLGPLRNKKREVFYGF